MVFFLIILSLSQLASSGELARVSGGAYKPILGKGKEKAVKDFYLDETAVTNAEYAEFVKKNPKWRKSKTTALFTDSNYLKHWKDSSGVADATLNNAPVVNISWFAAMAYCEWQGKRLPSVDEWEYVSQFGSADQTINVTSFILDWYSKPIPEKALAVKSTFKNKFGVWDVHGLIWEWNYDFNTVFVTGESRGDSALEKSMFCGSGSMGAANPNDYATFMRFAFRSSLKGNYTVGNLGFRCAKDL